MTRSADLLCDMQPSENTVTIGNVTLIDVEGYASLAAGSPQKAGGITARRGKVFPHAPHEAFKPFPFMTAHPRGVGSTIDDSDMSVTLMDGRLRFWGGVSGYSTYGRRIDPDGNYTHFPLVVPGSIETFRVF